jgi:hypothetical protein
LTPDQAPSRTGNRGKEDSRRGFGLVALDLPLRAGAAPTPPSTDAAVGIRLEAE